MNDRKSPISGHLISPKDAFKELGDPKSWKKESDAIYAEFRAKPKDTLVTRVAGQIKKILTAKPKSHSELVFAKKKKRRSAKKPGPAKRRKLREP